MVTYLLGAGASYNTLPLGNKLFESMFELSKKLENYNDSRLEALINDLKWLSSKKSDDCPTVDSYAKRLIKSDYILSQNELNRGIDKLKEYRRLKNALNAFLLISQHKEPEHRYIGLLESLLTNERPGVYSIRDNVRILSWNYDNQIEIVFSQKYINSLTKDVHAMLASYPSPFLFGDQYYQHTNNKSFNPYDYKISVIHLNGVAGLCNVNQNHDVIDFINSKSEIDTILSSLKVYDSNDSYLNFAWDSENTKTIDLAIRNTSETETLIIIGYSLPESNQQIDTKILSSFTKLKKIYFQNTPYKEPSEIKEELRNRGVNPSVEVIFEYNVKRFKVPDELE